MLYSSASVLIRSFLYCEAVIASSSAFRFLNTPCLASLVNSAIFSDLGDKLITVYVPQLEYPLIKQALEKGKEVAQALQNDHLIWGCILNCQNQVQSIFSQSIFSNSSPNHRQINNPLYAPGKTSFDLINATI